MKHFKDFGIKPAITGFVGDKIKVDRLLNKTITIINYKIENSRFEKGHGKCLHLQIEVNNTKHIVFTGSATLMGMIEQVPKEAFPFETTIVRENERLEFT